MSDERNEAGQFTAPSEPLFGHAALEQEAGYTPLPEEKKETDDLTVREAAEQRTASAAPESEIKTYIATGEQFADDKVTLTAEQAAEALTRAREAEKTEAEQELTAKLQKDIDDLRGEPARPLNTEPEVAIERAMEHPKVKEEIERATRDATEARERHVGGLAAATQIAELSILGKYPELASLAPEQRLSAFAAIAQNDPQRAEQIKTDVENLANVFSQYSAENERMTAERQQKMQQYSKAESERFEAMVAGTPKAERDSIEAGIVARIKEYGGNIEQFVKLMQGSEFASATVQRLLWDVGKFHKIMETAKPKPALKPIPPVQRPGNGGPRVSSGDEGKLADLQRQLAGARGDKQVRIAAQITTLRRARG